MTVSTIDDAKNGAPEPVPHVEQGDASLGHDGDLSPHGESDATRADAIGAFKHKYGIARLVNFVADDFDAPLPEDFLTISRE